MPEANDTGATLHSEFNKQAARYETNYTTRLPAASCRIFCGKRKQH